VLHASGERAPNRPSRHRFRPARLPRQPRQSDARGPRCLGGHPARLPRARFLLHATSADQRRAILERWSRQGIATERISFVGRLPFSDYLGLCAHIDLLLDTFPFNGATTTCDALWMGTPVVTCAGLHPFSRSGASLLDAAGLAEAIAYSVNDYIERVVTFANTPELLRELRLSLRRRLLASRLLDAPAFARAFAHALGSRI
jgi:protein O-GlcNAc transferase